MRMGGDGAWPVVQASCLSWIEVEYRRTAYLGHAGSLPPRALELTDGETLCRARKRRVYERLVQAKALSLPLIRRQYPGMSDVSTNPLRKLMQSVVNRPKSIYSQGVCDRSGD